MCVERGLQNTPTYRHLGGFGSQISPFVLSSQIKDPRWFTTASQIKITSKTADKFFLNE